MKQVCLVFRLFYKVLASELRKANTKWGSYWRQNNRAEDLEPADDICLLAHT